MVAYLLASLPTPRLGDVPDVTIEAFQEACGRVLDGPRLASLARALGLATPPVDAPRAAPPVERAWAELAARVDDAVVRARCARQKRAPEPFLRHPPGLRIDVEEAVARAFATPHPGLRERVLDELRWRLADELARSAPDGFGALYARALQVRLAWRWAAWDAEVGWRALEASLRVVDVAAGPPVGAADGRVHDA